MTHLKNASGTSALNPAAAGDPSACAPQLLATAHLAVALVAVFAAGAVVARWPAIRAGGHPLEVGRQASWTAAAAVAYLLITALAEFRAELRLRDGAALADRCAVLRLCGHAVVLGASLAAIGREWHSLALLAGLDTIVSALAAISLLTIVVALLECRLLARSPAGASAAGVGGPPIRSFVWLACEWAVALSFAGMLFYLELQPEPHSQALSDRRSMDPPLAVAFVPCVHEGRFPHDVAASSTARMFAGPAIWHVGMRQTDQQPAAAEGSKRSDAWRYRWHNGRWWYWTPSNRWLYWNNQGWVAHQPAVIRAPADESWRWGWDPANPFDRHPPGRPLNSPKVFPRNM